MAAIKGTALLLAGGSMIMSSVADAMERAHSNTARITGQLSIAVERRRINPQMLRALAQVLATQAKDLAALADKIEQRKAEK